jgi:hypothetical protein
MLGKGDWLLLVAEGRKVQRRYEMKVFVRSKGIVKEYVKVITEHSTCKGCGGEKDGKVCMKLPQCHNRKEQAIFVEVKA